MKLNFKKLYESAVDSLRDPPIQRLEPVVRELEKTDVEKLLPVIDLYNENPHYSRKKFERSFTNNCRYFGLFGGEAENCLALMSVVEDNPEPGFAYFDELAGFFPGKGYGAKLLKHCIQLFPKCWWMSSPDGGEALANNYRKIPGLEEFTIKNSCYKNLPIHFFMSISGPEKTGKLKQFLTDLWTGEPGKNKNLTH